MISKQSNKMKQIMNNEDRKLKKKGTLLWKLLKTTILFMGY